MSGIEKPATDQPAAGAQPVTVAAGGPVESSFGVEQHGLFGVPGSGDTSGFGGLVRFPRGSKTRRLRRTRRSGRRHRWREAIGFDHVEAQPHPAE